MEKCKVCGSPYLWHGQYCHKCWNKHVNERYNKRLLDPRLVPGNYQEPREKECVLCGAKFKTFYPQQIACQKCLDRDQGEYYARWWNERHPISQDVLDGLEVAMHDMHRLTIEPKEKFNVK